eukprot:1159500-Pelagomonas_calceolata.AAC.21
MVQHASPLRPLRMRWYVSSAGRAPRCCGCQSLKASARMSGNDQEQPISQVYCILCACPGRSQVPAVLLGAAAAEAETCARMSGITIRNGPFHKSQVPAVLLGAAAAKAEASTKAASAAADTEASIAPDGSAPAAESSTTQGATPTATAEGAQGAQHPTPAAAAEGSGGVGSEGPGISSAATGESDATKGGAAELPRAAESQEQQEQAVEGIKQEKDRKGNKESGKQAEEKEKAMKTDKVEAGANGSKQKDTEKAVESDKGEGAVHEEGEGDKAEDDGKEDGGASGSGRAAMDALLAQLPNCISWKSAMDAVLTQLPNCIKCQEDSSASFAGSATELHLAFFGAVEVHAGVVVVIGGGDGGGGGGFAWPVASEVLDQLLLFKGLAAALTWLIFTDLADSASRKCSFILYLLHDVQPTNTRVPSALSAALSAALLADSAALECSSHLLPPCMDFIKHVFLLCPVCSTDLADSIALGFFFSGGSGKGARKRLTRALYEVPRGAGLGALVPYLARVAAIVAQGPSGSKAGSSGSCPCEDGSGCCPVFFCVLVWSEARVCPVKARVCPVKVCWRVWLGPSLGGSRRCTGKGSYQVKGRMVKGKKHRTREVFPDVAAGVVASLEEEFAFLLTKKDAASVTLETRVRVGHLWLA